MLHILELTNMLSQALKKDQGIIEVVSLEEITKNILQKFHDEDLI